MTNKVKIWLAFIICLFFSQQIISQTFMGVVTDTEDFTVPGVSVYIEGTNFGLITDLEGKYNLTVNAGDVEEDSLTIVFSYIGFKSQRYTYPVNPGSTIQLDILLLEDIETLDEFVVIGYGVQKKSNITGAISTIQPKEITNLPITGIDQALQGKAAGVQVSQTTGAPGEDIKVRIRGIGTINNNDPLYIVDGVPTKNISGIVNPNEIESMTVLKDAASASIYGSRAGNGVVIINTKKGVEGTQSITYNGYVGMQTHGHLTPMTNTDQYIEIFNEAAANDGREPIPEDIYPQLSNTNWMKEIFQPAVMHSHNLTISGGSKKSNYLIGGGYLKQEGIVLNSDYQRINFRTSINSKLSEWVNVGINLNLLYSNQDMIGGSGDGYGGNGGSVVRYALFRTSPIPVYEANGEYSDLPNFEGYDRAKLNTWFGDGYNPVGLANKYDWYAKNYRTFGNLYANFKILEGLEFRSDLGIDMSIIDEKRFNENWGTDGRINNPSNMTKGMSTYFTWNWNNTLTYNKIFNEKHNTAFLGGIEAIQNNFQIQTGSDREYADQSSSLRYLGNGLTLLKGADEAQSGWSLFSGFFRANYNYDNRYLVEGVVRLDGSSRFSDDNKWGAFYSGSVGWIMNNEGFMENLDWITQLKPRFSIGQTGNQEIGLYNYLSIMEGNYNYPFGGSASTGYAVGTFGNTNTTWETTTTYDVGLDMAFLDDRLTVITDYYWRYTSNMLIPIPLPPSGGSASPPFVNAGEVLNRGYELEIIWRETAGEFKYELSGNLSTVHNEVLSLSNGRPIAAGRIDNGVYATLTEEGHPIGSFFMYEMEGIFQNELDVFSHAYQGPDIKPGDVKFKDQNGDGKITEEDRVHVGSAIPKLIYGFTGNFSWQGFDLSMFFQGAHGNSIYMQVNHDIEGFYRGFNVTQRYYDNRWTGEGSTDEYPRASWTGASNNKKASTRFIEPGSYFRLKNISLGYNFNLKETSALKGFRLYFSVQNAFTITKYPGLDPEMYDSDNLMGENVKNPDLAAGIDWGTYPVPRIFTLGLNLNL